MHVWCLLDFQSLQHLRSYQDEYQLVRVCTHDDFIIIVLPNWEIRPPTPLPDIPLSHSIMKLSQPVLILTESWGMKWQVSTVCIIDLTQPGTELPISCMRGLRSINSTTAPGMHVCIYSTYLYVCIPCLHVCIYVYLHMYLHMYLSMSVYACNMCIYMYVCMSAYMQTDIHVYIVMCICTCLNKAH